MTQASDDYRPLVRVRNLRFRYPGEERDVLVIPALDIAGSGLTALVGASGAGKSTLVELLAGTLREPYEGTIETLGVDIRSLRSDADRQRHLRRIGFIPQDFGLLPGRTIRQILEQDLADAQIPREGRAARIATAADAVGLTDFLDRQSNLLSGGQRQRAAIARMLARDVELVIADEPTANLDPERARGVLELFRQMSVSRPVIIVTHDPWLASECQRTVLLQAAGGLSSTAVPAGRAGRRLLVGWGVVVAAFLVAGGVVFAATRLGNGPSNVGTVLPPTATSAPASTPTLEVAPPPTAVAPTAVPATPTAVPVASTSAPIAAAPYGTCQLDVPGKDALISVAGPGVGSVDCQALTSYLVHNQWQLVPDPQSALPTSGFRCDIPTSLLPSGASGVVTDTGEFSTLTGDNACKDLGAG